MFDRDAQGHPSAERLPDEHGGPGTEAPQQPGDVVGVRVRARVARVAHTAAVPPQVHREHAVPPLAQTHGDRLPLPRVPGEAVQEQDGRTVTAPVQVSHRFGHRTAPFVSVGAGHRVVRLRGTGGDLRPAIPYGWASCPRLRVETRGAPFFRPLSCPRPSRAPDRSGASDHSGALGPARTDRPGMPGSRSCGD